MLKNATDFDYYDPQRIYTGEDLAFFGATIMRSLVAYKYSSDPAVANTLVPDMATDTGTANADATQWTFTLRDGLTWQDGSPVKCEDIKYGVSRTFATDVINGGPTYAIAYLDIPKAERRLFGNTRAHTAKRRPGSLRSGRQLRRQHDHLQSQADRFGLQLHDDPRLRRGAEPGRPSWR